MAVISFAVRARSTRSFLPFALLNQLCVVYKYITICAVSVRVHLFFSLSLCVWVYFTHSGNSISFCADPAFTLETFMRNILSKKGSLLPSPHCHIHSTWYYWDWVWVWVCEEKTNEFVFIADPFNVHIQQFPNRYLPFAIEWCWCWCWLTLREYSLNIKC